MSKSIRMTLKKLKSVIKEEGWVTDIEICEEEGCNFAVRFLDGNTLNCDFDNLVRIDII